MRVLACFDRAIEWRSILRLHDIYSIFSGHRSCWTIRLIAHANSRLPTFFRVRRAASPELEPIIIRCAYAIFFGYTDALFCRSRSWCPIPRALLVNSGVRNNASPNRVRRYPLMFLDFSETCEDFWCSYRQADGSAVTKHQSYHQLRA